MLITINSVNFTKADKGYMVADVKYLKDGADESKKIMSFAAPNVYAILEGLKAFPVDANIIQKKEGKYWNWKDIELGGKSNGSAGQPASKPAGKVLGSNYETSDERAKRQVYIVRQSSVSTAVELFKAKFPKGVEATTEEVIEEAKKIEAYVFEVHQPTDEVL